MSEEWKSRALWKSNSMRISAHFIKTSMKTPVIYAGDEIAATAQMLSNLRFNVCYNASEPKRCD